jgi:hypothetical protein
VTDRRPAAGLATALALVVAAAVEYRVAFPGRSDYAGHLVAGAGGTLLVLAAAAALPRGGPWRAVAVAAVAVLLGVGTEATVFRLAEFDPVDLANQSLGAVLVAAGFLDARRAQAPYAAGAALVLLVAGFRLAFA